MAPACPAPELSAGAAGAECRAAAVPQGWRCAPPLRGFGLDRPPHSARHEVAISTGGQSAPQCGKRGPEAFHVRQGRTQLRQRKIRIIGKGSAKLDHQRELDLDTGQSCGSCPEDSPYSFLFLAPSLQFLPIGFVKSERFRLGIPARPSHGKLGVQVGAYFLRTVASCDGLIYVRVGLGANTPNAIGRRNEHLRKAKRVYQAAFDFLPVVAKLGCARVQALPFAPQGNYGIRRTFG